LSLALLVAPAAGEDEACALALFAVGCAKEESTLSDIVLEPLRLFDTEGRARFDATGSVRSWKERLLRVRVPQLLLPASDAL